MLNLSSNTKEFIVLCEYIKNKYWDGKSPFFTIGTPVYNRSTTLNRTLKSIENQSFRDFELIIVDDGSKDDIDSVVRPFMEHTLIPTLYIKKANGGVHTARNAILKEARGKLVVSIDSDDELTPSALEAYKKGWDSIPEEEKKDYREVVAQCEDEKGMRCGLPFPENINRLPNIEAQNICAKANGEHLSAEVTEIRKSHPFPEPEGVTFYTENLLWVELQAKYKSYFINDIVRVYHQEGEDHLNTSLNTTNNKSLQQCKNGLWECWYILTHYGTYKTYFSYPHTLIRYSLMRIVLKANKSDFWKKYKLTRTKDKALYCLLYLPLFFYSLIYMKKRMK